MIRSGQFEGMDMKAGTLNIIAAYLAIAALQGCKHLLAITGESNIVDVNGSGHGCTFRQFQADDTACTQNEVSGEYHVNYKAKPRPGCSRTPTTGHTHK